MSLISTVINHKQKIPSEVYIAFTQGNIYMRRNLLLVVCNCISYQNLQRNSLPNPFAREKAGNEAATVSVHIAQNTQRMSALRSQYATQMQMRKYVYRTADSEQCFNSSCLISAVGVTDIYPGIFRLWFAAISVTKTCK